MTWHLNISPWILIVTNITGTTDFLKPKEENYP
jgi:hypothetical protein